MWAHGTGTCDTTHDTRMTCTRGEPCTCVRETRIGVRWRTYVEDKVHRLRGGDEGGLVRGRRHVGHGPVLAAPDDGDGESAKEKEKENEKKENEKEIKRRTGLAWGTTVWHTARRVRKWRT